MKTGLCMAFLLFAASGVSAESPPMDIRDGWRNPQHRQFDFWLGKWTNNWRSKPAGAFFFADRGTSYTHRLFPVLDGKAVLELTDSDAPLSQAPWNGHKVRGFSIRYFDEDKNAWVMAQNWPQPNRPVPFVSQLLGALRHGRIEVFTTQVRDETTLTNRYTFSDIRHESFRWDWTQTQDAGGTWRTVSIAELTRAAEVAEWPAEGAPTYEDGTLCAETRFRSFDVLAGAWAGQAIAADGRRTEATLRGYRMLDGCAVVTWLNWTDEERPVQLIQGYSLGTLHDHWFVYRLDNRPRSPHQYRVGRWAGARTELMRDDRYVIRERLEPLNLLSIDPSEAAGLERTVWERLDDDHLVFEWSRRDALDAPWRTERRFEFHRAP